MDHQAKALVIICMDFRFQETIREWLVKQGYNNQYDLVAMAGAAKAIDTILSQIELSHNLHQIKEVILINHQDCGAYGDQVAEDPKKELEVHRTDLLKAKSKILTRAPGLKVNLYFLTLKKEFVKIE